jgi:hypothetical protein
MSYESQSQLENDGSFQFRNRAVCVQQAYVYKDDARPSWVAVARGVLRDESELWTCFNRLAAGGPGIADKVDNGDGTIDSSKVTDGDLLSLTQANWPTVADLYFTEDGSPIEG